MVKPSLVDWSGEPPDGGKRARSPGMVRPPSSSCCCSYLLGTRSEMSAMPPLLVRVSFGSLAFAPLALIPGEMQDGTSLDGQPHP